MAISSKQIGWSNESNLLWQISKQLEQLTGVTSTLIVAGGSMAIGGSITSATAGSVLFAGTSGVLQQDNTNFFWDDANNRLGIGTNTPAYTLDINGDERVTGKLSINTPTSTTAALEITSTNLGVLFPRMTKAQRDAISSPSVSLTIYNNEDNWLEYYDILFGWMPISITNEWQNKYGFSYNNALSLSVGVSGVIGDWLALYNSLGTAASGTFNGGSIVNNLGCINCSTSISANGRNGIGTSVTTNQIAINKGILKQTILISLPALSTAAQEFIIMSGFQTLITSNTQTDGIFFTYDRTGSANGTSASVNFQCVTRSSSVSTVTDSGVVVAINTGYEFTIIINSTGTEVKFYINQTLVATHTTNINTTAKFTYATYIAKTVGTTACILQIANASIINKYN